MGTLSLLQLKLPCLLVSNRNGLNTPMLVKIVSAPALSGSKGLKPSFGFSVASEPPRPLPPPPPLQQRRRRHRRISRKANNGINNKDLCLDPLLQKLKKTVLTKASFASSVTKSLMAQRDHLNALSSKARLLKKCVNL